MSSVRGPGTFDPDAVGSAESAAWASYYRRDWWAFLRAAVAMVREGFGMGRLRAVQGAWHVLRANQKWAPHPHNDAEGAREHMRRFYDLVLRDSGLRLDAAEAARREVEWWRLHRDHQYGLIRDDGPLVEALTSLYAYLYGGPGDSVREAARHRVRAMAHSDAWVRAGCLLDSPLLTRQREAARLLPGTARHPGPPVSVRVARGPPAQEPPGRPRLPASRDEQYA